MSLKILICGLGSIGKRHAKLLKEHFDHQLFALRTHRGQAINDLGIPELQSWEEADRQSFDAAFITNPTFLHISTALECAKRKMNLFIEKPIDCKREGLAALLKQVEEKNLTSYVAYPLRFHPVLQTLKERLKGQKILHSRMICASFMPHWRSRQNDRQNYSSYSEQGGGVVLDLSHEIDSTAYLFGEIKKIDGCFARVSDLTIDSEDTADLVIFQAEGVTHLHLDYFSHNPQRIIEVDTPEFSLRADLWNHTLDTLKDSKPARQHFSAAGDEMYLSQLKYFFQNLNNSRMQNNLFDAVPIFEKIIEFKERHGNSSHDLCPARV